MQRLHVARLVFNTTALLLALLAWFDPSWSVIESPKPATTQSSREEPSIVQQLRFAPSEYCLYFTNGSSDCHSYAYQLTHSVEPPPSSSSDLAPHNLHAATPSNRLQAAVSSWCVAVSPSSSSPSESSLENGSWLVQGVQSMLCLVVLETCVYTMLLWLFLLALSVFFSLWKALLPASSSWRRSSCIETCASFTTVGHTCLALLLLVEWWGYQGSLMDNSNIAMLQLVVRYGASFRSTVLSLVAALVACRLSLQISGNKCSPYHLAKLYAMPLSPRRRRRGPWWSPRQDQGDDANDECLDATLDPLECPANYHV